MSELVDSGAGCWDLAETGGLTAQLVVNSVYTLTSVSSCGLIVGQFCSQFLSEGTQLQSKQ